MPGIRLRTFKGIIPRVNARLLPEDAAQTAQNVDLLGGVLKPLSAPGSSVSSDGDTTIYLWRRTHTGTWLHWSSDVDVVTSPIADDTYDRIYYSGDGTALKVQGRNPSGGSPLTARTVSLLQPPSAPSASVAWRLSTSGFGCKARTTNTVTWPSATGPQTQTDSGSEATGQLLSAVHSGDGKLVLQFQFPYKKWASMESNTGASTSWEAKSEFALRLTLGSDVWNDTYGATLFDDHHVLSDSGYNYADVYVENVQTVNRNPVWSYNETTVSPWNWARAEVPAWTAIITLKMNYQNYHAAEKYIHYVQTYVDDWGQEGPASVASERILVKPGQKITVARHGAAGSEPGSPYTARRLYRSAAGSEEDAFFFVAEQSDFTAAYEDNIQDANLGEKLPETENPVDGMKGLIAMPGGWLAAFKGNTMYCSEPFKPYNWPTEYQLAFDYNVVALAASGNDVVVLTEGTPYLVSGAEPETLTQTRLMIPQACVAKRGVAQISGGVIYPSPDGLVVIRGGQATIVTEPFYTRAEWQALTPATMIGNVHDDRYYGFLAAGGGIVVDFKGGAAALTTTTESATATFSDLLSDTFYVVQSGQIKAWGAGSALTLTWKSKVFEMDRSESFIVARVRAAGNVTLRLYADGVLKHSEAITSSQDVVLPRTLDSGTRWEFQVEAAVEVYEVLLVQRRIIDVGESPVVIKDEDGRFSWKGLLFRFQRTGTFHMGRLVAESGAVVKLYRDTTLDQSVTVTTDTDFRFAASVANDTWWLDVETLARVDELVLIPRRIIDIGDTPVMLHDREVPYSWRGLLFRFPRANTFAVGRLVAESYPVTMKLYRDTVLQETLTVADDADFKFGSAVANDQWEIEVQSTARIDEMLLVPQRIITVGDSAVSIRRGENPYTWKDLRFRFPRTGQFEVGKVVADSYPVTLKLYRDDVLAETVTVASDADFKFTAAVANDLWSVDLETTSRVDQLVLVPRQVRDVGESPVVLKANDGIVSWKALNFKFLRTGKFVIARVVAETYPVTMKLYRDTVLTETVSVANDQDFRFAVATTANDHWTVDLEYGGRIDELILVPERIMDVGEAPVVVKREQNGLSWKSMQFQFARTGTFAVGRLDAESYPVNLLLYRDGTLAQTVAVADNRDFRFDATLEASDLWEVRIDTAVRIDELVLIPRRIMEIGDRDVVIRRSDNPLSWRSLAFRFPRVNTFAVGRVVCDAYPFNLKLYRDGVVNQTVAVANDTDFEFSAATANDLWEVELDTNARIEELLLVPRRIVDVNESPVVIRSTQNPRTWRSLGFKFLRTGRFSVGRVVAESYPVTLNLYRDAALSETVSVANDRDFKFTAAVANDSWTISLVTTARIDELTLIPLVINDLQQPRVTIRKSGNVFSWLDKHVRYRSALAWKWGKLLAATYPVTLRLYGNGTLAATVSVTAADAFMLPIMRREREWTIDVDAGETDVYELSLGLDADAVRSR